jgi:hypothetical protein
MTSARDALPDFPFISETDFEIELGGVLRICVLGGLTQAHVNHTAYVCSTDILTQPTREPDTH